MNLNELQELYHEADLIISLKIDSLLQEEYKTLGAKVSRKLELADLMLMTAELKQHIDALKSILTVCQAVAAGRLPRRLAAVHPGEGDCAGYTSREQCGIFDAREPIASLPRSYRGCLPSATWHARGSSSCQINISEWRHHTTPRRR
jgi:hypothetical protein